MRLQGRLARHDTRLLRVKPERRPEGRLGSSHLGRQRLRQGLTPLAAACTHDAHRPGGPKLVACDGAAERRGGGEQVLAEREVGAVGWLACGGLGARANAGGVARGVARVAARPDQAAVRGGAAQG